MVGSHSVEAPHLYKVAGTLISIAFSHCLVIYIPHIEARCIYFGPSWLGKTRQVEDFQTNELEHSIVVEP